MYDCSAEPEIQKNEIGKSKNMHENRLGNRLEISR